MEPPPKPTVPPPSTTTTADTPQIYVEAETILSDQLPAPTDIDADFVESMQAEEFNSASNEVYEHHHDHVLSKMQRQRSTRILAAVQEHLAAQRGKLSRNVTKLNGDDDDLYEELPSAKRRPYTKFDWFNATLFVGAFAAFLAAGAATAGQVLYISTFASSLLMGILFAVPVLGGCLLFKFLYSLATCENTRKGFLILVVLAGVILWAAYIPLFAFNFSDSIGSSTAQAAGDQNPFDIDFSGEVAPEPTQGVGLLLIAFISVSMALETINATIALIAAGRLLNRRRIKVYQKTEKCITLEAEAKQLRNEIGSGVSLIARLEGWIEEIDGAAKRLGKQAIGLLRQLHDDHKKTVQAATFHRSTRQRPVPAPTPQHHPRNFKPTETSTPNQETTA